MAVWRPTELSALTPLEEAFGLLATSVDQELAGISGTRELYTFEWDDATARAAQTGMTKGSLGFQLNTAEFWVYSGSTWLFHSSGRTSATIPAASGWLSGTTVYRHNRLLTFGGGFTPSANGTFTGTMKTVGTLPSGFRPENNERIAVAHNMSGIVVDALVNATGAIQMRVLSGTVNYTTNTAISFAGSALVAQS